MALGRLLDDSYAPAVRSNITLLTVARLTTVAAYRFAPPMLATIARDFDVSLSEAAIALTISDLAGLGSGVVGRVVDRLPRKATMCAALAGVAAFTVLAGLSNGVAMFAVALVGMSQLKGAFDLSLIGWIAERVPYERRSRVVGLNEFSWAGGLLIGVAAMSLIAAVASWRAGYGAAAAFVVVMVLGIAIRLPGDSARAPTTEGVSSTVRPPIPWGPLTLVMITCLCLMSAAQAIFVTFGSWLSDDFGFDEAGIGAVVFGLGASELLASSSTVRVTDSWGKWRAIAIGAGLMVPSAALLATPIRDRLPIALVLLGLLILGFEFSIVSTLPVASSLFPSHPSTGIGLSFVGGTLGRALMSIPAARLYDSSGFGRVAVVSAACAAAAAAISAVGAQRFRR